MVHENRLHWRSVLATVLWLAAAIGGLSLLIPLMDIFLWFGKLIASNDPTAVTMDRYRILTAEQFGVFVYGTIWLAGMIGMNSWFMKARSMARLLTRFGIVAAVEAAIWAAGYGVRVLMIQQALSG